MNETTVEQFEGFEILWSGQGHWTSYTVCEGANLYLTGHTKWDGCTEITHHETHWCGGPGLSEYLLLLQHLYTESFKYMTGYKEEDRLLVTVVRN